MAEGYGVRESRDLGRYERVELRKLGARIARRRVYRRAKLLPIDVIVAIGAESVLRATSQATDSVPIVMMAVNYDPVAKRFIDNLARPGGNITGMFFMQSLLMGKRMELIKAALPQLSSVVALYDKYSADQLESTAAAAHSLGVALNSIELDKPPFDFDRAMRIAIEKKDQVDSPSGD